MRYRVDWCLLGREERCLDRGEIDAGFQGRQEALQALNAFLQQFRVRGRGDRRDTWWAKRSEEADIKVWITLREEAGGDVPAAVLARPPVPEARPWA